MLPVGAHPIFDNMRRHPLYGLDELTADLGSRHNVIATVCDLREAMPVRNLRWNDGQELGVQSHPRRVSSAWSAFIAVWDPRRPCSAWCAMSLTACW
jgi:hypothetical protein